MLSVAFFWCYAQSHYSRGPQIRAYQWAFASISVSNASLGLKMFCSVEALSIRRRKSDKTGTCPAALNDAEASPDSPGLVSLGVADSLIDCLDSDQVHWRSSWLAKEEFGWVLTWNIKRESVIQHFRLTQKKILKNVRTSRHYFFRPRTMVSFYLIRA